MHSTLSSRGQALVETIYSIPIVMSGLALSLIGLHSLFLFYLTDHWTYQASICLVEEKPKESCRSELVKKTNQLPYTYFQIKKFERNNHQAQVEMKVWSLAQKFSFTHREEQNLFIKSGIFGSHQ